MLSRFAIDGDYLAEYICYMSTEKFTPGPWRINDFDEIEGARSILGALYISDHGERGMANAALISAAPDMYEALRRVDIWFTKGVLEGSTMHDYVKSVLTKAIPK